MAKFAVFNNSEHVTLPDGFWVSVPGRMAIDLDGDGTIDLEAKQGSNDVWVWINKFVSGAPAETDVKMWTEVDDGLYQPLVRTLKDLKSVRVKSNPDWDDVKTDTDGDGVADTESKIIGEINRFKFFYDITIGDPGKKTTVKSAGTAKTAEPKEEAGSKSKFGGAKAKGDK